MALSRLQPLSGFKRIDIMKTYVPIMVAIVVARLPVVVLAAKIIEYDSKSRNRS
jgi:hypothetical protein